MKFFYMDLFYIFYIYLTYLYLILRNKLVGFYDPFICLLETNRDMFYKKKKTQHFLKYPF